MIQDDPIHFDDSLSKRGRFCENLRDPPESGEESSVTENFEGERKGTMYGAVGAGTIIPYLVGGFAVSYGVFHTVRNLKVSTRRVAFLACPKIRRALRVRGRAGRGERERETRARSRALVAFSRPFASPPSPTASFPCCCLVC